MPAFFAAIWGFCGSLIGFISSIAVTFLTRFLDKISVGSFFSSMLLPLIKAGTFSVMFLVFTGFLNFIKKIYELVKRILNEINTVQNGGGENDILGLATDILNSIGFFKALDDSWTLLSPLYFGFLALFTYLLLAKAYQLVVGFLLEFFNLSSGASANSVKGRK